MKRIGHRELVNWRDTIHERRATKIDLRLASVLGASPAGGKQLKVKGVKLKVMEPRQVGGLVSKQIRSPFD